MFGGEGVAILKGRLEEVRRVKIDRMRSVV